jgi:polyisoprenoid-binding protein YceI
MLWAFDTAHSHIQFSVKHMGISTVRGSFQQFTGTIDEHQGQVSAVTVDLDIASLTTNNGQRDDHLRGPDFFDAATHPTAHFALTNFVRTGDEVTATGSLTIRGVTQPITLTGEIGGPARDPWGNEKISAVLETKLSRKAFGLTWNVALEAGGVLVGDDVKLHIDVQAAPVPAAVTA